MAKQEIMSRIRVRPEVWKQVKAKAALEGEHLKDYLGQVLRKKVCERDKNGKCKQEDQDR